MYIHGGYYYPVRLGDNYGLLLDCSVNDKTNAFPVNYFQKLKTQITTRILRLNTIPIIWRLLREINPVAGILFLRKSPILPSKSATIGQTWMLSASVPDLQSANGYKIAKACYKAFMPDGNWEKDFRGQGCLSGGQIFELWRHRLLLKDGIGSGSSEHLSQPSIQNIIEDYHIIITLYPDTDAALKAAKFDDDWMRLFCYRHKILFASGLSRYYKQKLKEDFVAIQKGISDITQASSQKSELNDLRRILDDAQKTLSRYSNHLIYFDYQLRNINLNLDNYKKRFTTFQKQADDSNLKFLENFIEYIQNKDLVQLKWDYKNLSPGLKLLKGLMNSITFLRSIIEIDQQQRERRFQNNIAIVGVGVGSASVVASTSTSTNSIQAIKQLEPVQKSLDWLQLSKTPKIADMVVATTFSILMGMVFGVLTKLIIRIGETWRK